MSLNRIAQSQSSDTMNTPPREDAAEEFPDIQGWHSFKMQLNLLTKVTQYFIGGYSMMPKMPLALRFEQFMTFAELTRTVVRRKGNIIEWGCRSSSSSIVVVWWFGSSCSMVVMARNHF